MKREDVHVGQRIRIHPACDWFMRGAVYGRVTSILSEGNYAYIALERIGPKKLRARIPFDLLIPMEDLR